MAHYHHHYYHGRDGKARRVSMGEAASSPISVVLNILWLVTGGVFAALGWLFAAFLMAITIIGLPWARAAFDNARYHCWPFGMKLVDRDIVHGPGARPGPLAFIGNIIWFVLAGWWLAIGHLFAAIALGITIIGLPFAWAHLKLAGYALWPLGRRLVDADYGRAVY